MKFSTLISVANLREHYDQCIVIDCRFDLANVAIGHSFYTQGHLPDARYADLDTHLSSQITDSSGRHPLPDFNKLHSQIEQWGIANQSQVVVYDDSNGFFAARLWWLLRTMGHQHVAVLDGGIQAWEKSGGQLEAQAPTISRSQYTPLLNSNAWCDVDELQQSLIEKTCVLIDARAKERYDGSEEPIDPVAGHIPGALNLPITQNVDEHGQLLDPSILRDHYQQLIGNAAPSDVIHSCGSGVFACFGVLAMETAGLSGSRIYPGSWSEWIRDPARSIATN